MDDLPINEAITIPAGELQWRFSPSGGPGGQHANRSSTRAVLSFDVARTGALPAAAKSRILERLGNRTVDGVITVTADESRSQWRNRAMARRRLASLLSGALERPRPRLPTRPSRSATRRRLEAKRRRGEAKRLRRRPDSD